MYSRRERRVVPSKWEYTGWILAVLGMFILAVNHTAYDKGAYMGTWALLGVVYTCALLALRPKYRTTCWKAVKYGVAALLPYVVLVVAVPLGVWFVHHPGWFMFTVVACPILWAIGVASDMQSRTTHHDGRPGSHYFESQKKQWDNSK